MDSALGADPGARISLEAILDKRDPSNSLERVLAVLEVFSENRLEWTPEDLMETLGYSRPTLYRYLKTLKRAGLLSSMPNAAFTLGPKIVEMDYLLRKSDPLILSGGPYLRALSEHYACTALVVRWYGNRILCVDSASSAENPISSYPRGRPMPLGRGAIARSIIAFLPRHRMIPVIESNLDDLAAVGLGQTVPEILESLKRVRMAGYAVAYGEVTPGVVGLGAPVFDGGKSPVGSLCVTIAGHQIASGVIEEIGLRLKRDAAELTALLSAQRNAEAV